MIHRLAVVLAGASLMGFYMPGDPIVRYPTWVGVGTGFVISLAGGIAVMRKHEQDTRQTRQEEQNDG